MNIFELLRGKSVSFFGPPSELSNKILYSDDIGRKSFFCEQGDNNDNFALGKLTDVARIGSDIVFLDGIYKSVLIAKYPNGSEYVLLRLSFFDIFRILNVLGLLRRIFNKSVKIIGLASFCGDHCSSRFLVIKNLTRQTNNQIYLSLSNEVGICGLIEYLNSNSVNYVVPRFFEYFPNLFRKGGDIDILVHDDDAQLVRNFLKENPGSIPVDLHTVFGPAPGSGDMPYFTPNLALEMLDTHISGPIGAKIPNIKMYFYSFIYHIVFHKGFKSGLPSNTFTDASTKMPENNYLSHINKLSSNYNKVDIRTLEDCVNVLKTTIYMPKIDTMASISRINNFVKLFFFTDNKIKEYGLSVLILKEGVCQNDSIKLIESYFIKHSFSILRKKLLTDAEVKYLSKVLRGGNWYVSKSDSHLYFPRLVYVIKDNNVGLSSSYSSIRQSGIRILKTSLRKAFDYDSDSFFHATDDTSQALEYIEDIWGDSSNFNISKSEDIPKSRFQPSVYTRVLLHRIFERIRLFILSKFD